MLPNPLLPNHTVTLLFNCETSEKFSDVIATEANYGVECGDGEATEVKLTDTDGTPDVMNLAEIKIYGNPVKGE